MIARASGRDHALALAAAILVVSVAATACSDDDTSAPGPSTTSIAVESTGDQQLFPDVIDVSVSAEGDTFRFDVTVSSPYDTPERYADAWRVIAPDGTVLAVRELTHDHAAEQPFTRSVVGVEIPEGVTTVTVEGRDLVNGWGGGTQVVSIER